MQLSAFPARERLPYDDGDGRLLRPLRDVLESRKCRRSREFGPAIELMQELHRKGPRRTALVGDHRFELASQRRSVGRSSGQPNRKACESHVGHRQARVCSISEQFSRARRVGGNAETGLVQASKMAHRDSRALVDGGRAPAYGRCRIWRSRAGAEYCMLGKSQHRVDAACTCRHLVVAPCRIVALHRAVAMLEQHSAPVERRRISRIGGQIEQPHSFTSVWMRKLAVEM